MRRPLTRLRVEALEDRSVPAAGALDPTFGSGGTVFKDYGPVDPNAASAGVRALYTYPAGDPVNAGKVLGAGYIGTPNVTHTGLDFAVMRYNADGTPDATFGANGITITDFGNSQPNSFAGDDVVYGLAVDAGGRIVVVGSTHHSVRTSSTSGVLVPDFALARYTPAGQLDTDAATGFGPLNAATGLRAGKLTTTFPGGTATTNGSTARAVAVLADGDLLVGGHGVGAGGNQDFALARYNPDGSLDAGFGTSGLVTTPVLAGADYARNMVVQADGKVVLSGSAHNGSDLDFAAARFNPDGTPDTTFGTGGKVTTAIGVKAPTPKKRNAPQPPAPDDDSAGLVRDAEGRYVLAGFTVNTSTGQRDTALIRYTPGGALDTTFGSGGKVVTDLGGSDMARALALQPDGKLVVGGSATTSTTTGVDFVLARYNSNGDLDGSFGTNGKVSTAVTTSADEVMALTLQPDGRIVAGGYAARGYALTRYLGDPPAAPAGLAAAPFSSTQINLTWTPSPSPVTGYYVERSTDGVNFTQVAAVGAAAGGFGDTGLSPNTRYYYRIRAYGPNGVSAFSAVADALTLPQ